MPRLITIFSISFHDTLSLATSRKPIILHCSKRYSVTTLYLLIGTMRLIAQFVAIVGVFGAFAQEIAAEGTDKNYAALVRKHLTPLLSKNATITYPGQPEWDELNLRAATPRVNPNYVAVVEVATEADVQHTIKTANRLELPFLAVAGGHGWTSTISNIKQGIQINLRRLNTASVNADGQSATVGGGILVHELVKALYAEGKQAGQFKIFTIFIPCTPGNID